MWQGHLIHPVPPPVSPHDQPPLHRVYTPTPDGFERFLWDCLGLARGWARRGGRVVRCRSPVRPERRRSCGLSHNDRGHGISEARSQNRASEMRRVAEVFSLQPAMW
jgi:hypothetical protein